MLRLQYPKLWCFTVLLYVSNLTSSLGASVLQGRALEPDATYRIRSLADVIRLTRINLSNEYGSDSPELLEFEDLLGRTKYSTGVSTYNATAGIRVVRGPLPEHIASAEQLPEPDDVEMFATELIQAGLRKVKALEAEMHVDPHVIEHFTQMKGLLDVRDVPCDTQASCDKLAKMMNLCTKIRNIGDKIYDIFSITTAVTGQVISLLCGCIFIGPAHICALKSIPYTCVFPYQVFGTFMTASSTVWEVSKTFSSICRMYGDPRIVPGLG